MTRTQNRMQLDRLKRTLGQNTREGLLNNSLSNSSDKFNSSDNYDDNSDDSDATPADKSNLDFEGLLDSYLCGGLPDKILIEALKELNISDIKQILNNNKSKPFEKQKSAKTTLPFRI